MTRLALMLAMTASALSACTNRDLSPEWERSRVLGERRAEPAAAATDAPRLPRALDAFDGTTAAPLGWSDLVYRASQSELVLIGEVHGDAVAQDALAAFWEDLTARAGGAWLALEFFERDQQTAIDDYLAGVTTEDEFRKATSRSDGNYPVGHRAMLERAKSLGRPVIAANAPRRYARLARTAGFDRLNSLGEDQQRLFVVPPYETEGRYRTEFENLMRDSLRQGAHTAAERREQTEAAARGDTTAEPDDLESKVQGYFRSQNLWDATMADSVSRPALAGARPVVLVVGQFHTDHHGGLAERVRAAVPHLRVMTISLVDDAASGALRAADAGRADVVVYLR